MKFQNHFNEAYCIRYKLLFPILYIFFHSAVAVVGGVLQFWGLTSCISLSSVYITYYIYKYIMNWTLALTYICSKKGQYWREGSIRRKLWTSTSTFEQNPLAWKERNNLSSFLKIIRRVKLNYGARHPNSIHNCSPKLQKTRLSA